MISKKQFVIEIFGRLIEKLRSVYIHNGEKPLPPVPRIEHVKPNEFNVNNVIDTFNVVKDHPFYKTLIKEAPYANGGNVLTNEEALIENKIYPLPATMDAPFEYIENPVVSRIMLTTWVLWFDDRVVVHTPRPTTGRRLCGPEILFINDPAEEMPEGVLYAIKVVIGTTLVDGFLRGVRWTHYSKK